MKTLRSSFRHIFRVIFLMCLLVGLSTSGYSQTKIQKDGKYKQKSHKSSDHHKKEVRKDGKHKKEFRQHSGSENQAFSKKKRKKLK